jgi:hypothetical protein
MDHKLKMLENIYDLLKGNCLNDKQQDEYAKLSRKFEKQAKRELKNFIKNKNIELDFDNKKISIGKHFVLTLK